MEYIDRYIVRPTPEEFEEAVESVLRDAGFDLTNLRVLRREHLKGADGCYEIDVTARFEAFGGASFLVLVECKRHTSPIKREVIQILRDKILATGAHKGMLVSTSSFQSGALEYAQAHGIALVHLLDGSFDYIIKTRSADLRGRCGYTGALTRPWDDGILYSSLRHDSSKLQEVWGTT